MNLSLPEPPPIANDNPSIHDIVIEELRNDPHGNSVLIPDIEDRKQFGLNKYGVPLQVGNGRTLIDVFQELLDAIVYLKKEIIESGSDDLNFEYFMVICLAVNIKKRLSQ